jgi:DNA-binding NarL/FixJ family response regulator
MSREGEDVLFNFADYSSLKKLKLLLSSLEKLKTMAHSGNSMALCIFIDLTEALKSAKLTNRQQQCLHLRFVRGEQNNYIAEQLNITESGVRKNIEGGLIRLRKVLLGSFKDG